MATERVKRILFSRDAPFSDAEIDVMTDRDGWRWIYANDEATKRPKDTRPQVCFTGFTDGDKAALQAAASVRFHVVSSVTRKLDFLVTGPNPGPKKLEKAAECGATIVTLAQFDEVLKSG